MGRYLRAAAEIVGPINGSERLRVEVERFAVAGRELSTRGPRLGRGGGAPGDGQGAQALVAPGRAGKPGVSGLQTSP